ATDLRRGGRLECRLEPGPDGRRERRQRVAVRARRARNAPASRAWAGGGGHGGRSLLREAPFDQMFDAAKANEHSWLAGLSCQTSLAAARGTKTRPANVLQSAPRTIRERDVRRSRHCLWNSQVPQDEIEHLLRDPQRPSVGRFVCGAVREAGIRRVVEGCRDWRLVIPPCIRGPLLAPGRGD